MYGLEKTVRKIALRELQRVSILTSNLVFDLEQCSMDEDAWKHCEQLANDLESACNKTRLMIQAYRKERIKDAQG